MRLRSFIAAMVLAGAIAVIPMLAQSVSPLEFASRQRQPPLLRPASRRAQLNGIVAARKPNSP